MGIQYQYYERDRKRWTAYDGERIETPGYRAVAFDYKDFSWEGTVKVYVEARRHAFLAWHELPKPGEVEDVKDGLWPTLEAAQQAAIKACVRDMVKNFEVKLKKEKQ
jgi:hypothetical protein